MRPSTLALSACPPSPARWVLLAFVVATGTAGPAAAQSALSIELAGGTVTRIAMPAEPSVDRPGHAPAFGVHFALRRAPSRDFVLGFSQRRYGCEAGAVGCAAGDGPLVSTGWDVGMRWRLRSSVAPPGADGLGSQRLRRLVPWVQLAAVFRRVEGGVADDGNERLSDLSAGGEAGVGLWFVLAPDARPAWRVGPSVRAGGFNTRFPDAGLLRMRYVVAELVLRVNL